MSNFPESNMPPRRKKKAANQPELLRRVNLEGEAFEPGQEDEFLDYLDQLAAEVGEDEEPFDKDGCLYRLEAKRYIKGFADVDDVDLDEPNITKKIVRRAGPARASELVSQADERLGRSRAREQAKGGRRVQRDDGADDARDELDDDEDEVEPKSAKPRTPPPPPAGAPPAQEAKS
jgi:hypothetical protein